MYDPSIGQWLEEDPIGFAGGDANLRRYVGNDPTNATDPTGHELLALGKAHAEYVRERLKKDFDINTYAIELPGNGTGNAPGKYAGSIPEGVSRETLWAIYPESNFGRMPRNLGKNAYAAELYWGLMNPEKRVLGFEYDNGKAQTIVTMRDFNKDEDLSWRDRIALYVENSATSAHVASKGVRPSQGDIVKLAEATIAAAAKGNINMADIIGAVGAGLMLSPKPVTPPVVSVPPKATVRGVLLTPAEGKIPSSSGHAYNIA